MSAVGEGATPYLGVIAMVTDLMEFDAPSPGLPNLLHLRRNIYGGDDAHLRVSHPGFAGKAPALAEELRGGKATPPVEGISTRALPCDSALSV